MLNSALQRNPHRALPKLSAWVAGLSNRATVSGSHVGQEVTLPTLMRLSRGLPNLVYSMTTELDGKSRRCVDQAPTGRTPGVVSTLLGARCCSPGRGERSGPVVIPQLAKSD